jgi:hypothetical protein
MIEDYKQSETPLNPVLFACQFATNINREVGSSARIQSASASYELILRLRSITQRALMSFHRLHFAHVAISAMNDFGIEKI